MASEGLLRFSLAPGRPFQSSLRHHGYLGLDLSCRRRNLTHQVRSLLQEFRRGLDAIYGQRLRGIYRYGAEVERTGELAAALSLDHGITISQVFLREEEWLHGDTPFLANVREEAIAA